MPFTIIIKRCEVQTSYIKILESIGLVFGERNYLFSVCVNIAWMLARAGGYKDDLLALTHSVATVWLQTYGKKPDNPGRSQSLLISARLSTTQTRYDNVGHHIVKSDPLTRHRCKLCNSQSVFTCKKCKVHVHQKCSVKYHTM